MEPCLARARFLGVPYWLEPSYLIVGPSENGFIITEQKTTKVTETFPVQTTSSEFFSMDLRSMAMPARFVPG